MANTETKDPPRYRHIAEAVGLNESQTAFAEQLDAQVSNDGGYTDREAGLVYATARIQGAPVKPREVAGEVPGIDADDVVRDMRRMVGMLPFDVTVEDPVDFVDKYVDALGLSDDFRATARSICGDATDAGLHSGKAPSGFAAAVVYATSDVLDAGVMQSDVCEAADVTEMTVRTQYRDIIDAAHDFESMKPTVEDLPDLVERVADAIDRVPDTVADDARSLAEDIVDERPKFARKTKPKGVAAGVFYVASESNRFDVSMREVADAIGVSKHTVVARVQDVRYWIRRRSFDGVNYNELKRLASENDVDVGQTPEREYLIERLIESGVEA